MCEFSHPLFPARPECEKVFHLRAPDQEANVDIDPKSVVPLELLHRALITLAQTLTPLIAGIVVVGILLAVIQGAFQFEDGALAMGAKVAIILAFAGSSGVLIYETLVHIAHAWIAAIPTLVAQDWH